MGDAGMGMLDGAHFAFIDMHAVGGDHFGVEDAAFLHIRNDRHPKFLADILHLTGCFSDVNMERNIIF